MKIRRFNPGYGQRSLHHARLRESLPRTASLVIVRGRLIGLAARLTWPRLACAQFSDVINVLLTQRCTSNDARQRWARTRRAAALILCAASSTPATLPLAGVLRDRLLVARARAQTSNRAATQRLAGRQRARQRHRHREPGDGGACRAPTAGFLVGALTRELTPFELVGEIVESDRSVVLSETSLGGD